MAAIGFQLLYRLSLVASSGLTPAGVSRLLLVVASLLGSTGFQAGFSVAASLLGSISSMQASPCGGVSSGGAQALGMQASPHGGALLGEPGSRHADFGSCGPQA